MESTNEANNPKIKIRTRVIDNKSLCRVIAFYAEKTKNPFTCKDFKEHILNKYEVWVETDFIRKSLKINLGYSYKSCSSRPLLLNHSLSKLKKVLFSVKLWKMIAQSTVQVNIDESFFSWSTKRYYSWSLKGSSSSISNIILLESISIVSAITSNGVNISGIRKGTIDSNSFIEYIKNWRNLKENIDIEEYNICLILDNSPVHWSEKVRHFLNEKRCSCIFLPQLRQSWHQ